MQMIALISNGKFHFDIMSNPYFRFKKFVIHQDKCAMKVCTDSCLFGAWITAYLKYNKPDTKHILDIGAGTGLLSLMLAQQLPSVTIDAVEIEPLCFDQAETNILQSPWHKRIQLYNDDISQFALQKKYDVIISNPPFYERDITSESDEKKMAHHSTTLTLQGLITAVKKFLTEYGCFAVLLPYKRMQEFEKLANENGFFVNKKTLVRQTARHSFFRVMLFLSRDKEKVEEDELFIKNNSDEYSPEFIFLLKNYYLHL